LRRGEKILNGDGEISKLEEILKTPVPEDDRSKKVKKLYETKEWTYEQLGEEFGLSAASICHIINSRVGFETEIITIGHSSYNKDCIQVTADHWITSPGSILGAKSKSKEVRAGDLKKKDSILVFERDKNTGEIQFVSKPIVILEKKLVKAKLFYDLGFDLSSKEYISYIAKGIVCGARNESG
jgi:intein/homing endonuclease